MRKRIKCIYEGAERQPINFSDEKSQSVLARLSQEVIRQAHLATAIHMAEVIRNCDSQEMKILNHNEFLTHSRDGKRVQI